MRSADPACPEDRPGSREGHLCTAAFTNLVTDIGEHKAQSQDLASPWYLAGSQKVQAGERTQFPRLELLPIGFCHQSGNSLLPMSHALEFLL